mmetsp:Transcript_22445/g.64501  ORF Transcript_22445/g.64501 Transcript_22445/m.64501 type:complete len:425 (-) Transcript_22445:309-1583(-)
MAPLAAGTLSGPRCHPRLEVGRPSLNTVLLLQQLTLSVHLLEDTPRDDQHPHADCRDEGSAEELPCEHGRQRLLRLHGLCLVAGFPLRRLHLLLDATHAGVQLLWSGDHVDSVFEGGRQGPVRGPPRLAGLLLALLQPRLRHGEVVQPQGPSKLDDVPNPCQTVHHRLPHWGGREHTVVNRHADNTQKRHERHHLLDRDTCGPTLARHVDDVQLKNTRMRGDEGCSNRICRPNAAQLREDVAHGVQAGSREPMGHKVKDANARIHVVGPPFLLQPAVQLEVLRIGGRAWGSTSLVLAELADLVLVPLRHPAVAQGQPFPRIRVHLALERRRDGEGDAEHIRDALFLVAVPRAPGLVQHLWRWNGQTHMPRQHESAARGSTGRRVHRHPREGHKEAESATYVRPIQAEQPAGRRRAMHTETTGHD